MQDSELNKVRGERLSACIAEKHLKQKDVAEAAHFTEQHISKLVRGKCNMTADTAMTLANVLNVRMEYLLCKDAFQTVEDLNRARSERQLQKHFFEPSRINDKIGELIELLGYEELEATPANELFFNIEMPAPPNYCEGNQITDETIIPTIKKGDDVTIRTYFKTKLKRKLDGKTILISDTKTDALFDDIIDFIKYRIDREFK